MNYQTDCDGVSIYLAEVETWGKIQIPHVGEARIATLDYMRHITAIPISEGAYVIQIEGYKLAEPAVLKGKEGLHFRFVPEPDDPEAEQKMQDPTFVRLAPYAIRGFETQDTYKLDEYVLPHPNGAFQITMNLRNLPEGIWHPGDNPNRFYADIRTPYRLVTLYAEYNQKEDGTPFIELDCWTADYGNESLDEITEDKWIDVYFPEMGIPVTFTRDIDYVSALSPRQLMEWVCPGVMIVEPTHPVWENFEPMKYGFRHFNWMFAHGCAWMSMDVQTTLQDALDMCLCIEEHKDGDCIMLYNQTPDHWALNYVNTHTIQILDKAKERTKCDLED